jgi:hypothetical protein
MSEIAVRADLLAKLEEGGWISPTALVIDRELPYDKAESLAVLIGRVGSASRFWAGDILVYAENVYGERAAQLSEALNFSEHSRQDAVRVSLAIPPSRRRPALSWWHHRLVAASWISPADRDRLLDRAEGERLTTRELETLVRDLRALGSESRGATGEADCDVVLDRAVDTFHHAVVACYGKDATFEVVVKPTPGAELILRPSGDAK